MLEQRKNRSIANRVGLDVGSHSVTGVEVMDTGADTVIHSAGSIAIPGTGEKGVPVEPGSVVQAIKSLWSSASFGSKRVVLALPSESVYMKWLHLEASSEEDLANIARSAAVRGAPFPPSDAIVDYRILSSRGTASKNVYFVMLVAASASAVDRLLNTVETAGLEPLAVDVSPVAVLRGILVQNRASDYLWSGQPQAHCQIGANSTSMTVMRGSDLEFARTVPVGSADFTACIVEATGLDWESAERLKKTPGTRLTSDGVLIASREGEELLVPCESAVGRLAREMHRSLKFFRSQFAEGSYLGMTGTTSLSGGGALLRGIDACLEQQGIEISSLINPFAGLSVAVQGKGLTEVVGSAPQYTAAVGLAVGDYWSDAEEQRVAA